MRSGFWAGFSLFLGICGAIGSAAERFKEKEIVVEFAVQAEFSSEDENSPYFFSSILDICSNSRYVYITDWKESKITILDKELKFIKRIGRKGQGPGEFSQIFADINCDDNRFYVLTINRFYVFSREGEYENDVTLRFIPRRIMLHRNNWMFKMNNIENTIVVTNQNGEVLSQSIPGPRIQYKNCPPTFANPEAFLSSTGILYTMDTTEYRIRRVDPDTMIIGGEVKRRADFEAMTCQKQDLGEFGYQYMYTGGFSWFLENEDQLLYFFRDTKKNLRVDSYRNDGSLTLNWSGIVRGEFRPLAVIQGDRFLGTSGDSTHVLAVAYLKQINP